MINGLECVDPSCLEQAVAWAPCVGDPDYPMPLCHYHFYEADRDNPASMTWERITENAGLNQGRLHAIVVRNGQYYNPYASPNWVEI